MSVGETGQVISACEGFDADRFWVPSFGGDSSHTPILNAKTLEFGVLGTSRLLPLRGEFP